MWRLVEIGEVIENGDEIWADADWNSFCMNAGQCKWVTNPVRRWAGEKKPAVPAVSVGDRVEVVSGTWAKSCGVVLHLPFRGTLGIKLENVFVGGKSLTIRVSSSEVAALKSAPKASVQVDPEWRMLETGEVIREGDEIYVGKWEPCVRSIVALKLRQDDTSRVRRRVRLRSPGWRYLDVGETVQAGDHAYVENAGFVSLPILNGSKVSNERMVRRKTTTFAGGYLDGGGLV
jgi:hypothetical protein